MSIKQDRCLPRTALDVDRRYSPVPNDVEELKGIIKDFEVDTTLSASSSNAISNSAVTKALNNKVTKVAGKNLSTNDFTDEYKAKVDSSTNITVDSSMSDTSTNPVQNKVVKKYVDDRIATSGASDIYSYSHSDSNGYIWFTNGFLVQWGRVAVTPSAVNTDTTARITYLYEYDDVPDQHVEKLVATPSTVDVSCGGGTTVALSKQGMNIYVNSQTTRAVNVNWEAKGHKSIT